MNTTGQSLRRIATVAVLLTISLPAAEAQTTEVKALRGSDSGKPAPLSTSALQAEVMRFADHYATAVAQAADEFRQRVPTSEARTAAQTWKLGQSTAAFIDAANPSPVVNALDMVVLATLSRTVQEDYWVGSAFGEPARPLLETHRQLEREAWSIAEGFLSSAQQQELRALIAAWRAKNPDQRYVGQTRLRDFAESIGELPPSDKSKPGSIFSLFKVDPLAGLEPSTRAIEQARLLAERSAFYLQRLPTLLSWQAELLSYQLVTTPESKQILADTDRLTKSTEVFAKTAEQLPQLVNDQREAAIKQLLDGLAVERANFTASLAADDMKLRATIIEMRQTIEAGTDLSKSLDTTIKSLDTLMVRFDPGPKGSAAATAPAGRPFDILDYAATAKEVTVALQQLNTAIASIDKTVPQVQHASETFERAGNRLLNRFFLIGAGLIVLLLGGAVIAALFYRRLTGKSKSSGGA